MVRTIDDPDPGDRGDRSRGRKGGGQKREKLFKILCIAYEPKRDNVSRVRVPVYELRSALISGDTCIY